MGSIVIDGVNDYISRSANLPTGALTLSGWVKFTTSTSASIRVPASASGNGANAYLLQNTDNGYCAAGDSTGTNVSPAPADGVWVYMALRKDATQNISITWWNAAGVLQVSEIDTSSTGTGAPTVVAVGNFAGNLIYGRVGKYAYWKLWDAELSDGEIEADLFSPTFVRTTNANTGFADSATDIGPNGRNWTLSGTTTDSDAPPVVGATGPAFDTAANGYTIAYNTSGSPNTTITGTRPANVVDGELMLAVVGGYNQNNPFVLTAPAGWTPVYSPAFTDGVSTCAMGAWTRVANAASDNFVWTVSADTPDDFIAILRVTGADTSNPLSGTPTESYGSSVSPISPTTQTAHDNALAVFITAATGGSITATDTGYPSGTTGVYARASRADLNAVTHSLAYKAISTVGATGAQTFTNLLSTTGKYWAAASFAIRPDPGGGGGGSAATIVAYYQTMQD
jgi:hypothetical protein